MAKFKDFGTGTQNENAEPISFKLHGEEFHCMPQMQGAFLLDIITKSSSGDAADTAQLTKDLFGKVLAAESYERFEKLINDKERIVSVETLGEIVGWLVGQYSSRPEEQPED